MKTYFQKTIYGLPRKALPNRMPGMGEMPAQPNPLLNASFNPLKCSSNITLSNGNMTATMNTGGAGWKTVIADTPIPTGRSYWEIRVNATTTSGYITFGFCEAGHSISNYIGSSGTEIGYGLVFTNGGNQDLWRLNSLRETYSANGVLLNAGVILGFALDTGSGKMWVHANGGYLNNGSGTGNPGIGENGIPRTFQIENDLFFYPGVSLYNAAGESVAINFGGTAFAYTNPWG